MNYPVPRHYTSDIPSQHFQDQLRASDKNRHLITLCGPVGTGKTYDACAWLNYIHGSKGLTGYYIKCSDVWSMTPEDMFEITIKKCIVMDDYGRKQSVGNLERISDIIDKRIEKEYCYTVITTNILTEIRNIDERLASRLNAGVIIDYSGMKDRRLEK